MPVYPRGQLSHVAGALVSAAAAWGVKGGTSLSYLAQAAMGALCSWIPWDSNNQRKFLAGSQPQGTTKIVDGNAPRLSAKEAYLLVLELKLKGRHLM